MVSQDRTETARFPLHTLEGILCFSYAGASPALMGACAQRNVDLAFFTPRGRFLARAVGETKGNVLLRQQQYRAADDPGVSCRCAKGFLLGKVYNARWVLERATRDHPQRVPVEKLKALSGQLAQALPRIEDAMTLEELRGIEGEAAQAYFRGFDFLILQQRETFSFTKRTRRPPLDPVNALLSFAYTLLARDCAAALEGVGLDPYVGFFAPAPARPDQPGAGPDGGAACGIRRPFCPDLHQPKDDPAQTLYQAGEPGRPTDRRGPPGFLAGLAAAQATDDPAPVFVREDPLGAGTLCAGAVVGPHTAGRPGGVSAVFLEVNLQRRETYACPGHL